MGESLPQHSLTNKPNVGRVPPVRAGPPLAAPKALDAPQVLQVRTQPPQPTLPQQQGIHFQVASSQQSTYNSQGSGQPGYLYKNKVIPKDMHNAQEKLGQVSPKVQDLGQDMTQECSNLQGMGGINIYEVSGESRPSYYKEQPPLKVQFDKQGRELAQCGCLKRVSPPPPPSQPPCPVTPDNAKFISNWFLNYYAASSFDTCRHQPLPLMSGQPPLRIHVKEGTDPVAIRRPSTIPAHWVNQVKEKLERDIALGVLERVLSNTPTTWRSRMHVVGKKTGEPRRVVDLRALNSATTRQTQSQSPHLSRRQVSPLIPGAGARMRGMATTASRWMLGIATLQPF